MSRTKELYEEVYCGRRSFSQDIEYFNAVRKINAEEQEYEYLKSKNDRD